MAKVYPLMLPPRVAGDLTGDLRLVMSGFSTRATSSNHVVLQFLFWGQEGDPVRANVPVVDPGQIPSALNAVAAELAGTIGGPGAPASSSCDLVFPLTTDEANFAAYLTDMVCAYVLLHALLVVVVNRAPFTFYCRTCHARPSSLGS
jgi:hypothetical protein